MSFAAFRLLTDIQTEVVAHLRKQPFFAQVPIIAEDVGEDFGVLIEDRIDAALGDVSKGLVGIVVPTVATLSNGNAAGIYYERINVVIRWIEMPVTNRVDAGLRVLAPWAVVATNYYLGPAQFTPENFAPLNVDNPPWVRVPDDAKIIYDCNHYTHGGVENTL
jgi:hypothetical protein